MSLSYVIAALLACFVLALSLGLASAPALSVRTVFGAATKEEKQKLDAAAEAKKKLQEEKKRTQNMIAELITILIGKLNCNCISVGFLGSVIFDFSPRYSCL